MTDKAREREIEKQKKEPKKSKRQREREYMLVINQSYQSILIHLTIDVLPQGGQTMNRKQEQQIVDYYSTANKYIRSKTHSNAHQTVFTKENDKFQWLVLEQKSQCEVEVRQTDRHGTITARDNYELTRNLPKCVGVERLCEGANFQIPFNADEINLIYQFGEQSKAETCASLSAILPQVKDSDTKQIVSDTLKKLNALSEESCTEIISTTKRRKLTERDHSIKARLARAKEQQKKPIVTERKQQKRKAGIEL